MNKEKRLLVHIDDIGMSHSANIAASNLFKKGDIRSGSIMMPCAWAFDFVKWLRENPVDDIGIHFTHTCEWDACRWRPLTNTDIVSDLLDADGFMKKEQNSSLSIESYMNEMEMQLSVAKQWGLEFSHIDSHMFINTIDVKFLEVFLSLSAKEKVPSLIPPWVRVNKQMEDLCNNMGISVVDTMVNVQDGKTYEEMKLNNILQLEEIGSGLNVMLLHPVVESDEIKAIIPEWKYRVWQYELFMDDEFIAAIKQKGIRLINWRDL